MTDKELLLLAAKAAGITIEANGKDFDGDVWYWSPELEDNWNPLYDDGDAFRLAVKLYLVVSSNEKTHGRKGFSSAYAYRAPIHSTVPHDDNPNAATRRAIVMTAAKIGETL